MYLPEKQSFRSCYHIENSPGYHVLHGKLPGIMGYSGLMALRGMHHRCFQLESMVFEAQCAFQFLRN